MKSRTQAKFVWPPDVVTPPRAQSPEGIIFFNRLW